MWSFFEKKIKNEQLELLSDRFPLYVNHTIEIFEYSENNLDYEKLYRMLFHKNATQFEINEICIFCLNYIDDDS
ncbi:hypothetical protein DI487_13315 [Flavobacterium sediminis]|uniref:Uncharacterized protein n=1 Tax=Flavobacterium sediminis TaxID=2201181 RepID=A0A2U8QXE9_9FLAO|nr:hypothetical protein DI487_13315 [Flavobacterium sediminis]